MDIHICYFSPQVLQCLLQRSIVTARRIEVERAYTVSYLRDYVPDQVLSCEVTADSGKKIFHV